MTFKNDGTGALNRTNPPAVTSSFKWEKTTDGALLHFDTNSNFGASAVVRPGADRDELIFKTSSDEAKLERVEAKRREIDRLFRVTGLDKRIEQTEWMLMSGLKARMTNVPVVRWQELEEKNHLREARENIVGAYDVTYSLEELKTINAFYESPAGKKEMVTSPRMWQNVIYVLTTRMDRIGREAADAKPEGDKK